MKELVVKDKNASYKVIGSRLPLCKWIREQGNSFPGIMQAVISNFAPLGEEGEELIRDLFPDEPEIVDKALAEWQKEKDQWGVATYEAFTDLGYDGEVPKHAKTPYDHLLARKEKRDLNVRGLAYSKQGTLQLNPNIFSRYFQHRLKVVLVKGQGFYAYHQDGYWVALEDVELGKLLRTIVHEAKDDIWKSSWHTELMTTLKLDVPQIDELNPNPELINVKNGMLNLRTFKLTKHHPKCYSSIQLPISYNPDATCPRFEQFLDEIFDGDPELKLLIPEIMGYCLTRDRQLQKAFIFHGGGANGKSVLAEVMRQVAGKQNVSNVPLAKLSERFGLQDLPNKTLNISTENEFVDKHFNTQNFKAITGGDTVNVEQKYRDSYSAELYCKLVILVNSLPRTSDYSHGYYRRLVIIPFNRVFKEDADPDLLSRLMDELEGILVLALKGYRRLVSSGYQLTESQAVAEELTRYKSDQNPVLEFVRDKILKVATGEISRRAIYDTYLEWSTDNGIQSLNRQQFWKAFRIAIDDLSIPCGEKKVAGQRYFTGIIINRKRPRRILYEQAN